MIRAGGAPSLREPIDSAQRQPKPVRAAGDLLLPGHGLRQTPKKDEGEMVVEGLKWFKGGLLGVYLRGFKGVNGVKGV